MKDNLQKSHWISCKLPALWQLFIFRLLLHICLFQGNSNWDFYHHHLVESLEERWGKHSAEQCLRYPLGWNTKWVPVTFLLKASCIFCWFFFGSVTFNNRSRTRLTYIILLVQQHTLPSTISGEHKWKCLWFAWLLCPSRAIKIKLEQMSQTCPIRQANSQISSFSNRRAQQRKRVWLFHIKA